MQAGGLGGVEQVLEVGVELLAALRLPVDLEEGLLTFQKTNCVGDILHQIKWSLGLQLLLLADVRNKGVH